MTREEIAQKLGITINQVKRIIHDGKMSRPYTKEQIAQYYCSHPQLSKQRESMTWDKMWEYWVKTYKEETGLNKMHFNCPESVKSKISKTTSESMKQYVIDHPDFSDRIRKGLERARNDGKMNFDHHYAHPAMSSKMKGENNPFYGKHHTDETKQTIGLKNVKTGEDNPFWGKHHTDETKNAISKANAPVIPQGFVSSRQAECITGMTNIQLVCRRRGIQFYTNEQGASYYNLDDIMSIKRMAGTSGPEKEIADWVKSIYKGTVVENDRNVIAPMELDIYIPERNVAIEFDGLYWHCSLNKDNSYHLNKTCLCEDKGIRLIHVYEDEWKEKRNIVKSIIKSALGIYDRKYYARNLEFKKIEDKRLVKDFLEVNHIHGNASFFEAYGLFDKGELVQCISFRKNFAMRTNKSIELARMATKLNCQVIGGFSKLMKNQPYEYVDSFVDRRLFNASGYKASNWYVSGYSKPSYYYTDGVQRFNRQQYMKQKCIKKWNYPDQSLSEEQMCNEHGLYKIFDCGTVKASFFLNKKMRNKDENYKPNK